MSFASPNTAILPRHPVIIGDQLSERGSGKVQSHVYPANGRITCEINLASAQDVGKAVQAARAAFPAWHALPGDKRRDRARLVLGGERLGGEHADGYYLPITIIADVDIESPLAQHEVFGPVLAVTPFDTEEEAIALANATSYGLGAYIHTENLRRAHYVASQMQAGMVQVNGSGEGMQPFAPFGGMKQSGYGRLGGEQGLHEFLQVKNVWMNLAKPQGPK